MAAIVVLFSIHLTSTGSLKEKRGVVRPLVERLRRRLSVSVAEVADHDELRRAQIGVAIAAPDLGEARRLAADAQRFVDDQLIGHGWVADVVVEELTLESELR